MRPSLKLVVIPDAPKLIASSAYPRYRLKSLPDVLRRASEFLPYEEWDWVNDVDPDEE